MTQFPVSTQTHPSRQFNMHSIDHPLASYWLAAIESDYAQPSDWISWVQRVHTVMRDPPEWIVQLGCANSRSEALSILWPAAKEDANHMSEFLSLDDVVLGFMWMRFERHDIDLCTCLDRLGKYSDSSGATLDCEVFYDLLNQFEAGLDQAEIIGAARNILRYCITEAEREWEGLMGSLINRATKRRK